MIGICDGLGERYEMEVGGSWIYQGRQYHQWFGHGTAPKEEQSSEQPKSGILFDPPSVARRIDYATGSLVARSPRDERSRWEARLGGPGRESLKTA